jgi:predicted acylesterase/phospholipase RssA
VEPDVELLREMAPILALRVDQTRAEILKNHVNDFGPEHLDAELRQKQLALVLGGGGGAGLVHLGTFGLIKELGVTPELIVGSSMGSIMGLLRAIDRSYDPVATAMAFPRELDYNAIFRPFTGYTRYGFPGAFHMNLLRVAREIFTELVGSTMPRFSDLPIKLEIVASGIRTGYDLKEETYTASTNAGFSALAMTRRLKLFFKAMRDLSKNPRFLSQVVFGREPGTEHFPVVEAVGFSCSVPGLLHYDIFHDDPETIEPLDHLFDTHRLLRLCDGGVVNNVPSQVAWESIQSGSIGNRNVHIMAFDVFAPVRRGSNVPWMPVQQIARGPVLANRPYSDYHKTFHRTPSPLQVIVTSYSKLKSIIEDAREQLAEDEPYMRKALEQLPPYGTWEIPS